LIPPELEKDENERRYCWARAWLEYARRFERRLLTELGKDMYVAFSCDLPYGEVKPKISPRLRLPTGEYLDPVVRTNTVSPVGPTPSVTDDTTVPVSEDKKDEKKAFPWRIVIVVGVIALLIFTMSRR